MMNINDVDSDVKVTQLRRREPKKKANEVEGKDGSCKYVVRYMTKHIRDTNHKLGGHTHEEYIEN